MTLITFKVQCSHSIIVPTQAMTAHVPICTTVAAPECVDDVGVAAVPVVAAVGVLA